MAKKKLHILSGLECHSKVVSTAMKAQSIIVQELETVSEQQRFLLASRMVMLIFQRHFQLTWSEAHRVQKKRDAAQRKQLGAK